MSAVVHTKRFERKLLDKSGTAEVNKPRAGDLPCGSPREGSAAGPLFQVRELLIRVEGDRDLLPNAVKSFSLQWNGLLAELDGAAKRNDGAALQAAACRLKRSLGSIGAGPARRLAQELEEMGSLHDVEPRHDRLQAEIERLVTALTLFARDNHLQSK